MRVGMSTALVGGEFLLVVPGSLFCCLFLHRTSCTFALDKVTTRSSSWPPTTGDSPTGTTLLRSMRPVCCFIVFQVNAFYFREKLQAGELAPETRKCES